MSKLAVPVLAASLLVLGAPAASADHLDGACHVAAAWTESTSASQEYSGVLTGAFADSAGGAFSVTCWIQVDGVRDTGTDLTVSGVRVATGSRDIAFQASDGAVVELCTDDGHGTGPACEELTAVEAPPQVVLDLLDDLLAPLFDLIYCCVDPPDLIHCPIFASLSPGVPGIIDISPEGDVYVAGDKVWDCPPYHPSPPDGSDQAARIYLG